MQKNIKLIVSDMDGTLLDKEGNITQEFWDILPMLEKKGVKFAVASGRQYATLKAMFADAQQDIIFIAENGGLVSYQDEILAIAEMPKTELKEMIHISRQQEGSCFLISGEKSAYIEQPDSEESLAEIQKYFHKLEIVEDLTKIDEYDDRIVKLTSYNPKGSEKYIFPDFEKFQENYDVVLSGASWIDICNPGVDKGKAVEQIKQKFGITTDEVMIFGDHLNDASMMPCGTYSYAMKNA
ncbi:MAG: HAD family hydrolase, partial [candidate division SR1 bacterium]